MEAMVKAFGSSSGGGRSGEGERPVDEGLGGAWRPAAAPVGEESWGPTAVVPVAIR